MANKIQLTTSELKALAQDMKSLEEEYTALFSGVSLELTKINSNWSSNLSHNFAGKITSSQRNFLKISEELKNGAKVATTCAFTFESVDSQLAKMYCNEKEDSTNSVKNTISEIASNDASQLEDIFSFIDDNYNNLPEPARNLIKNNILKKAKYGDVSYVDIYELTRDLSTGNLDWGTAANVISMGADALGKKNSFVKALTTAIKVAPKYVEKENTIDERVNNYIDNGDLASAFFTGTVGTGTVIVQGVVDGICKTVDKTLHLSDASDLVEILSGGKLDIGGYLKQGGQGISDAFDYVTDLDNYADIGRYYSDFYGGIVTNIGNTISDAGDVVVDVCDNIGNFFKNLF